MKLPGQSSVRTNEHSQSDVTTSTRLRKKKVTQRTKSKPHYQHTSFRFTPGGRGTIPIELPAHRQSHNYHLRRTQNPLDNTPYPISPHPPINREWGRTEQHKEI